MFVTRWVLTASLVVAMSFVSSSTAQTKKKDDQNKIAWAKVEGVPEQLRKDWKLSEKYERHADAQGIPVLAFKSVDERALQVAVLYINKMLSNREDVRKTLIEAKVRVGIIPREQETTDLPEYHDLPDKAAWNKRSRGLGATPGRPLASVGEENLLGLPNDRYRGESILIHEFSHTFHTMGLSKIDQEFDADLKAAFKSAQDKDLWRNTYAMRNEIEYWAEGVQSYFDCNLAINPPNGVHNHVNTREKLKVYDPKLFKLIDGAFKSEPWRWKPPIAGLTIPAIPPKPKK